MKKSRSLSPLDAAARRYTRQARRDYIRAALRLQDIAARNPRAPKYYSERILCGAYARTTGEPCRRPGTGRNFRCRLHGSTRRPLAPLVRALMHDFYSKHGKRGAAVRWARVRAAGGLDDLEREFLSECGRAGAKARWRR